MNTHTLSRAGGTCLLGGAALGVISLLVEPTLSTDPATLAGAIADHPGGMLLGGVLNIISISLVAAGLVWWAWTMHDRTPRLATFGGVLGVFGILAIVFDGSAQVVATLMTRHAASTSALQGLATATGVTGPVSVINDIGMILLAVAALRSGVTRAVTSTVIVGIVLEAAGFAFAARYLAALGLLVLLVGFAGVVRAMWVGAPETLAARHAEPAV